MPHVEITTRIGCRVDCSYCAQTLLVNAYRRRSSEFVMGFDVFRECVGKIPADVRVNFSGMCEPWLNSDCTRMVRYAHQAGHVINVFTTAVGMKPSDVDELRNIPFERFVVHLPSAVGHERIVIDDDYLATLRCLRESGIVTQWHCHMREADPQLGSIIGPTVDHLPPHTRAGSVRIEAGQGPGKKRGRLRCGRQLTKNVLLPNGDVLLCCMDYGMKHVIGNLKTQDYLSLFEGPEWLRVRAGLSDPSADILCRLCEEAVELDFYPRVQRRVVSEVRTIRSPRDALLLIPRLARIGVRALSRRR
ncbi:MAG: SPASM domain-containing protein [Thermoleophilia bacterium]|nr:SPASM domain-containing protein [Thermoleophilia bacterium]